MLRMRESGYHRALHPHDGAGGEPLRPHPADQPRAQGAGRHADEVKEQYQVGCARRTEGDTAFIAQLPMVASVSEAGRELDIMLKQSGDDQALLAALVGGVRVRSFRIKTPRPPGDTTARCGNTMRKVRVIARRRVGAAAEQPGVPPWPDAADGHRGGPDALLRQDHQPCHRAGAAGGPPGRAAARTRLSNPSASGAGTCSSCSCSWASWC